MTFPNPQAEYERYDELRHDLYPSQIIQGLIARMRFNLDILDKSVEAHRNIAGFLPHDDASKIRGVINDADLAQRVLRSEFSDPSRKLGSPSVVVEINEALGTKGFE